MMLFLVLLLLVPMCPVSAQKVKKSDTLDLRKVPDSVALKIHSPSKAAIYSAVLPGMGQLYNRKYWKIPVVYAGFGILTYFIVTNANQYIIYQSAYIEEMNGDTEGNYADYVNRYTADQLMNAREYYRRNLEVSILLSAVWYSLNILDAVVDAHLMTFDISDELALKVQPAVIPAMPGIGAGKGGPEPVTGIRISLKF